MKSFITLTTGCQVLEGEARDGDVQHATGERQTQPQVETSGKNYLCLLPGHCYVTTRHNHTYNQ